MRQLRDLRRKVLETRAREAHRAYIEALSLWEDAWRRADCACHACSDVSDDERERLCSEAEAEKARRRIAYRNLCDDLGYMVTAPNVGLEDRCDDRHVRR